MDKVEQRVAKKHTLYASENAINMSGVTNVVSYDDKEIIMTLSQGSVTISGENFNIERLDTEQGLVDISGKLHALKYGNIKEKQSIIKRILK